MLRASGLSVTANAVREALGTPDIDLEQALAVLDL
jgi:hypothetical protein